MTKIPFFAFNVAFNVDLKPEMWKQWILVPLPPFPRFRICIHFCSHFRFCFHQNVVILLVAIPPTNVEVAPSTRQEVKSRKQKIPLFSSLLTPWRVPQGAPAANPCSYQFFSPLFSGELFHSMHCKMYPKFIHRSKYWILAIFSNFVKFCWV